MVTEFIGFLIIVGGLLAVIIRRQQKKTEDESLDIGIAGASAKLCQQVEAAGDQMIDRVEVHVAHLEQLIERADEKIALLDQKIMQLEQLASIPEPTTKKLVPDLKPVAEDFATLLTKAELQTEPVNELEIRETGELPLWKVAPASPPGKELVPGNPVSPRNRKVFALMDEGCSEEEISRKTGIGKGALALIREMYKVSKVR